MSVTDQVGITGLGVISQDSSVPLNVPLACLDKTKNCDKLCIVRELPHFHSNLSSLPSRNACRTIRNSATENFDFGG
jgi:hypothetical protein